VDGAAQIAGGHGMSPSEAARTDGFEGQRGGKSNSARAFEGALLIQPFADRITFLPPPSMASYSDRP